MLARRLLPRTRLGELLLLKLGASPPDVSEMAKAAPPKDFESALAELEKIVAQMESGKLGLEESLAAYARGAVLLAFCRDAIARAEEQVQVLENGVLKPFTASSDE